MAWYTSAAGVTNGVGGQLRLPVGKPLITQTTRAASTAEIHA